MKIQRGTALSFSAPLLAFSLLSGNLAAHAQDNKYACTEPTSAQTCTFAQTCGSPSSPCTVDVKRTDDAASATPGIPNAKGNSLFCVNPGTTVVWKSTQKGIGFIVDMGPSSPFDPSGSITGGSARSVTVVAKRLGCFKYSVSACHPGEIYGMCGTGNAVIVVVDKK